MVVLRRPWCGGVVWCCGVVWCGVVFFWWCGDVMNFAKTGATITNIIDGAWCGVVMWCGLLLLRKMEKTEEEE